MSYLFSSLIFVVIAGFIFNQSVPIIRYKTRTYNGYYLILITFISGLFLYVISYISIHTIQVNCLKSAFSICELLSRNSLSFIDPIYSALVSLSIENNNSKAMVTEISISAVVLAFLVYFWMTTARFLLPKLIVNKIRKYTLDKFIYLHYGVKARLINYCFTFGEPVLLTLSNRKSYVGYITEIPYMDTRENWGIKILPLRSGYRDQDNLNLVLENDYHDVWNQLEKLSLEDGEREHLNDLNLFGIIINWDDIQNVSVWIPNIYENFNIE